MTSIATDSPPGPGDGPSTRTAFPVTFAVPTRWADVDVYGHVNNAVHYQLFDTAVNGWLMRATGLDIRRLDAVGLVVETGCRYLAPLHHPSVPEVGIGVSRLGRTSIAYRVALFPEGSDGACAVGRFVHVYVDRADQSRVVPIPDAIRAVTQELVID